ncbi:MAG TPA: hypothetical protein VNU95_05335 [Candidatus Acidoferrales bacterium]|jgi:hypothetical protein|nr:hypothetical protein [Candidatus Acidoferrales bacterium]
MTGFSLFPTADPRVRWLRIVLLGATLSGMLSCIPLWLSTREYPLVPICSSWPVLPPAFGILLFVLTLASLVAALWFFRPAICFFLAATLYLYSCDQNRGQPWMYLYWVMLLLSLFSDKTVLPACQLALALVYFWAGIQKLNGTFFTAIPAWFVQPAIGWGVPHFVVAGMRATVALTPFLELFISVGIWFRRTRWLAIVIAAILHGAALLFLGPLGYNVNLVVWPWNIAMVALLVVLFGSKECAALPQTLWELCRSWGVVLIVGLYALLPILSFFGCWDSYFSFSLYSANLSRADLYVTQSFRARLPARLQKYVDPVQNYDPSFQLPYVFEHPRWAAAQLEVPELPEPRGYAIMFRRIAAYATNANDCRMIVETRGGKVLLYRPGVANPVILRQ